MGQLECSYVTAWKIQLDIIEVGLGGEMFTIDQSSFDEHAII